MENDKIIQMSGIEKSYHDGTSELRVLKRLHFDVTQGDFIAIVGKSGSGKSTLLNIISLLDRDYRGNFVLGGKEVRELSNKERFFMRTQEIGYVFQSYNLITELTVLQNVEMPLGYGGKSRKERQDRAIQCIEQVGLSGKEKKRPYELSGGEQQRVSIARALSVSPTILIADEPTGNLDVKTGWSIIELFKELNKKGTSILLVTHDSDIAKECKKLFELKGGQLYEN